MLYVIMRSLIIVMLIFNVFIDGKSTKKSKDENPVLNKKLTGKSIKTQPAIIAIEIVDPNENSTTTKNSKRTIGGSLGYGYQNNYDTHPPRYEVYKYSQHDIPPYPIDKNQYNQQTHQYEIQESISYKLPENNQQFYQPGTTLFSTINNQGHIGGLSTQLPQQYDPHVPVIILKVYPSQLADSGASLHANLPQTHPLAATVNSIDIQSLLARYVQNMLINQNYHQEQYQQPQQQQQHDGLITDENYPKDTHTRIIFRDNKIQPPHSKIVQATYNSIPQMQGYHYNLQQNQEPVVQSYYYQQEQPQQQQQYYQNEQYDYEQAPQTQQQQNYLQNYQDYSENRGFAPSSSSPSQNYQYVYQESNDETKPHNYHAHPKRSQRAKNSHIRPLRLTSQPIIKDIKQLNPIK